MPGTWLDPEVTKVNKKEAVLGWAQHWEGRGYPCPGPQKKWCLSLSSRERVTGEGANPHLKHCIQGAQTLGKDTGPYHSESLSPKSQQPGSLLVVLPMSSS